MHMGLCRFRGCDAGPSIRSMGRSGGGVWSAFRRLCLNWMMRPACGCLLGLLYLRRIDYFVLDAMNRCSSDSR